MHIELIDLLRCPRDHEETWLVAALNAVQDRFVLKATLGCPICGASYTIKKGIADLRINPVDRPETSPALDPEAPMRAAALLNLTKPGSLVILEGSHAGVAQQVSDMTECKVIALNPASSIDDSETVATVVCDTRIPFASASVTGIALENTVLIADAPRVIRQGGRVLLPANEEVPPELVEIARDDRNIVAESVGTIVELRR